MFDPTDTRRTSPASIYRANRALGRTARYALDMARYIAGMLQALELFAAEFIYGENVHARYTLTDENAGVQLTYELWRDTGLTPEDIGDCYTPEDLQAWKDDEWHYYGVTVTATMGTFTAEESLGGIDAGDYFESPANPLDTEQQVMSTALEHYPIRAMIDAVQDMAIAKCLQVTR